MKKYLIPKAGKFYKANVHTHTNCSDGKLSPEEIKAAYLAEGYSIVAFTDHEIMLPHPELADESFLPITGVEIAVDDGKWSPHTKTYHINILSPEMNRHTTKAYFHGEVWGNAKNYMTDDMIIPGQRPRKYSKEFVQWIIDSANDEGCLVCINHPTWSKLPFSQMISMLDYDSERVLGIEIYNDTCEQLSNPPDGWDLENWDAILMTGRRCWGFAVPDHHGYPGYNRPFVGRNILLTAEASEHDCLKAYRNGEFYCQLKNGILGFTKITITEDNLLHIETVNADRIDVIADGSLKASVNGNSMVFDMSTVNTYCRIEAHNQEQEDSIFSNPIRVN